MQNRTAKLEWSYLRSCMFGDSVSLRSRSLSTCIRSPHVAFRQDTLRTSRSSSAAAHNTFSSVFFFLIHLKLTVLPFAMTRQNYLFFISDNFTEVIEQLSGQGLSGKTEVGNTAVITDVTGIRRLHRKSEFNTSSLVLNPFFSNIITRVTFFYDGQSFISFVFSCSMLVTLNLLYPVSSDIKFGPKNLFFYFILYLYFLQNKSKTSGYNTQVIQ